MKPPFFVTCYPDRRGVLLLAGSLGLYDGEWREGLSLIMRSLEPRHSKPASEPAMKELARLKPRCGFRHPVTGRESGAGFAFALLGLRSHSRHSQPQRLTLKDQPHRLTFPSSELAHEEPVAELPPSPCFRAADTSFARLGNYATKVHETAVGLRECGKVRSPKTTKPTPMSRRCGLQLRLASVTQGVSALLACSTSACDLAGEYGLAGTMQSKSSPGGGDIPSAGTKPPSIKTIFAPLCVGKLEKPLAIAKIMLA